MLMEGKKRGKERSSSRMKKGEKGKNPLPVQNQPEVTWEKPKLTQQKTREKKNGFLKASNLRGRGCPRGPAAGPGGEREKEKNTGNNDFSLLRKKKKIDLLGGGESVLLGREKRKGYFHPCHRGKTSHIVVPGKPT